MMKLDESSFVNRMKGEFGISPYDIYKQMDFDNNILEDSDGIVRIGKDFGNPLITIERFVERIAKSSDLAFEIKENKFNGKETKGLTKMGKSFFPLFNAMISVYDERYDYSEHVKVFFDIYHSMQLHSEIFDGVYFGREVYKNDVPQLFDEMIQNIRSFCKTKEFRRKLAVRKANSVRNFNSLREYVDALFERHSRMLVLRIDFGYKNSLASEVNGAAASNHRETFLKNMRTNSLFKNLLGYVWKLEYGEKKGHHFHFAFFFDGSKLRHDAHLASRIGKYWEEEIVKGYGTHYNCNRSKSIYKKLGIGMISHDDSDKRQNLILALSYLTKKDQYLREKLQEGGRTLGKGQPPKPKVKGLGRPRRSAS